MNTKSYLLILSILLIFLSNFICAEELDFSITQKIFTNLGITENKEEIYLDHGGVLYPPENELRKQGLNLSSYKQQLRDTASINRNSSVANIWGTSPLSGTVHIPVLLVQFSDNQATYTQSQLNEAFNSSNYLVNNISGISLSKYYYKQSYGDLNLVFDVYDWRTAPSTYSYYSQNNTTSFQLGIDTVNLFNPYIDYTQYDNDNDGRLDGMIIIYPGVGTNAPNGIWPHARILRQYNSNPMDGKYLGNIAFVPEKSTGSLNAFSVVTVAHEFAHVLGLMDLYSINPTTGAQSNGAVRQMTMMAHSVPSFACAIKPINLDVWSRYFFGWIEPEILTTDSNKNISLRSVNDYPDAVILKNNNFGTREFFIIENRYRSLTDPNNLDKCMFSDSTYDTGGFAIYHVDEQYIEENYPTNSIMYDSDSNYCGDTISHPGLLYEQNYVTSCSTSINVDRTDLYFNSEINNCNLSRFDENQYMCPGPFWFPILDLTTRSYTGVNNTFVRFQAISPASQFTMNAKMLVGQETANPELFPNPGTYPQTTQVTINTTTPNAIIYYTTDGTNPTTNSLIYTSPITVTEGTTTIKAIAKRNDYYISDIMSSTYTITGTVATPTANQ
ncbi:MAG TPA: M6 family metalloprotease domain-containing protein, partial [archaeon]|nr:M6 family metalloprotease domain-containing protein [archaeon]